MLFRSTFSRLSEGVQERLEVIVRFLAVLELYKRGWVELTQPGNLAELQVTWVGTEGGGDEAALFPAGAIEEYQG